MARKELLTNGSSQGRDSAESTYNEFDKPHLPISTITRNGLHKHHKYLYHRYHHHFYHPYRCLLVQSLALYAVLSLMSVAGSS